MLSLDRPPFAAAEAGGLSINPTHWWDLDDDGVWDDAVGTASASEGSVTVAAGAGPGGQDVAEFDTAGDYLYIGLWVGSSLFTSSYSWSCWLNFSTLSGTNSHIAISWRTSAGGRFVIDLGYTGGANDSLYFTGPGSADWCVLTGFSEAVDTWYHYVATWTGTSYKLWINGNLEMDKTGGSGSLPASASDFRFGHVNGASGTTQFYGKMGMVGMWNGLLSQDDVDHLYNSGNGRQYADLTLA